MRDHVLILDELTFKTGSSDDERLLKDIHYGFTANQPKRRSRLYAPPQEFAGEGSSKLGLSTGELSFAEVAQESWLEFGFEVLFFEHWMCLPILSTAWACSEHCLLILEIGRMVRVCLRSAWRLRRSPTTDGRESVLLKTLSLGLHGRTTHVGEWLTFRMS